MINSWKIFEYFNKNKKKALINSKLKFINTLKHTQYKYILWMFPYPSGDLHIGHVWNATLSDSIAIYYKIFRKKYIFQPIGWDSFGLPAEVKAIKENKHPKVWTKSNIENMTKILEYFGFSLNFDSVISTADVEYYKFDQEIFRSMFKQNLVYRKQKKLFFCDVCNTILAKEQVINRNNCWRCSNKVKHKLVWQWFININKFWDKLNNFADHDKWDKQIINSQKEWIKKKECYILKYKNIKFNIEPKILQQKKYGYQAITNNKTYTKYKIFNKISVKLYSELLKKQTEFNAIILDKNTNYNQEIFDLINQNKEKQNIKQLNDWNISRKRYWGTPIPLIKCISCGWVIDENVVHLPQTFDQLSNIKDFINIHCPKCHGKALRCDETLDTFFSSSWYMLRYLYAEDRINKFDPKIKNIDVYIGGKEHNTSHILFSRFFYYFFQYNKDIINKKNIHIDTLINQGLILGNTKFCLTCKKYIKLNNALCEQKQHNIQNNIEKISKSKLNSINLSDITKNFCPDIIRLSLLAAAPIKKDRIFNLQNLYTQQKFYNKMIDLWNKNKDNINKNSKKDIYLKNYRILQLFLDSSFCLSQFKFHLVISKIYTVYNHILSPKNNIITNKMFWGILAILLRPLTPSLSFYILDKLKININSTVDFLSNFQKYQIILNNKFYKIIWLSEEMKKIEIIAKILKLNKRYSITRYEKNKIYIEYNE